MSKKQRTLTVEAAKALRFDLPAYVNRRKFLQHVFGLRSPVEHYVTGAEEYGVQAKVRDNSTKVLDAIRGAHWP